MFAQYKFEGNKSQISTILHFEDFFFARIIGKRSKM
jgi:hypothetical protein